MAQVNPTPIDQLARAAVEQSVKLPYGPLEYDWQATAGEADCGVFRWAHPGHAYAVFRAPRYAKRDEWERDASWVCAARTREPALAAFVLESLEVVRGMIVALEDEIDTRRCATNTLLRLNQARALLAKHGVNL